MLLNLPISKSLRLKKSSPLFTLVVLYASKEAISNSSVAPIQQLSLPAPIKKGRVGLQLHE